MAGDQEIPSAVHGGGKEEREAAGKEVQVSSWGSEFYSVYWLLRSPIDKKSKENSAVTVKEKTFLKDGNEDLAEKQIFTVESEWSRLVTF